jgi:D-glycero-beta-D-manno-heptose 1-phosphate adenylyltransferase
MASQTPTPEDLKGLIFSNRDAAKEMISSWQKEGLKVGFTSGVFDLLHLGHLDYLQKAKAFCDRLVVAINSDSSVRQNKGPSRPMVHEKERSGLIAGLKPVDAIFIFDELNNNLNIETLRPDVYIKAGDYDISRLSSAPLVQSYGGEVKLIPVVSDTSSSDLIEKIQSRCPVYTKTDERSPRPAIFLDRDGVINTDEGYLHQPEKFKLAEGALEGLELLSRCDVSVIIVTNQAGIGLGYFKHEDFYQVNRAMFKACAPSGIRFDRIYYCPHGLDEGCSCRKPSPGMLERAFEDLPLLRDRSWLIGDRRTDLEAAKAASVSSIMVQGEEDPLPGVHLTKNLKAAVTHLLDNGHLSLSV